MLRIYLILSIVFTIEPINFESLILEFPKNQPSINLTIAFDF